jgi:dephospho-CoA kinase
MLKVALTGGIATGKSHVLERMQRRGVPCLDADLLAHGVTAAGTEATAQIAERFGPEVLDAGGAVDRRALGAIVFADELARRDLEGIVHPAVYRAIEAGLRAFERLGGAPLAVVDIPLLFETGRQKDFDCVVVTSCPEDVQRARLRQRGLNDDQINQRLAAQWPAAAKAARGDYVIDTNATYEATEENVDRVLAQLMARAG